MAVSNHRPINILCIDGGPSVLPTLYVLEEMFSRLKFDLKSEDELRPCDYFDFMGGSGSGGLIALLLGRLYMTVSQAIEAYMTLAPILSLPSVDEEDERKVNSTTFEQVFHEVMKGARMDADELLLEANVNRSKTLAFTVDSASMSIAYPLRSYTTRTSNTLPCTILQAACACVASPNAFSSVTIGEAHRQVVLVDATIGYANPISELLREAKEAFGGEVKVATIVSLGAEIKNVPPMIVGTHEMELIRRVNADCERVHEEMQTRLREAGVYHRFRLEHRFRARDKDIFGHVSAYLRQGMVSSTVDAVVKSMQTRSNGPSLQDITSVTPVEITLKPRPSLVDNFVGREDILLSMRQTHFGTRPRDLSRPAITVLTGLGGSGKTQITLKFAFEYEWQYPGAPVYFVDGSKETTLKTDLEMLIHSQGSNYRSASYEDAVIWLATKSKQWLLIIDNLDDPSVKLSSFIPRCSHGHVIVTTRDTTRKILAPTSAHAVEGLSTSEAVTMLLKASGYESNSMNRTLAKEIVDELGYLPLALAHAAAYISIHQCLSTFLSIYRQSRADLLTTSPDLIQGYPRSVAATIQMSLDHLSSTARDLLRIFAHLDARSIAYVILAKAAERRFRHVVITKDDDIQPSTIEQANVLMRIFCPSQRWLLATFEETISMCLRYSLLRVAMQNEERFYSMHVLVQNYLQDNAGRVQNYTFPQLVTRILGSAVTISDHNYDHFTFNRLLFPHARLIDLENVSEAGDHCGLGTVLRELGDGAAATAHIEKGVEQWKKLIGEDGENTLVAMRELGNCYEDVGREEKALEIREHTFGISRRVRGVDNIATLRDMHNLATSYSAVGRKQEALELRETVLEKRRNLLGDDHRDTLQAMGNLAYSYFAMGHNQEALLIQRYVLSKLTTILGEEHARTLQAMHYLALTYSRLEMIAELENLLHTALPLHEEVLGIDHEHTKWLHQCNVRVRSRATEGGINMDVSAGVTSNTVSPPEMQLNGKRKRSSQGSQGNNKRRE